MYLTDERWRDLLRIRGTDPGRSGAPMTRGAGREPAVRAAAPCSWWPRIIPRAGRSASARTALAMADRRDAARTPADRAGQSGGRRRAGLPGRRRGAAAAGCAARQGRHRLDEPRRPGRGRLGDRGPVHRLRRAIAGRTVRLDGGKMLLRTGGFGSAHHSHPAGLRRRGVGAGRARADGDGRAAALPSRRVRIAGDAQGFGLVAARRSPSPPAWASPRPTPGSKCRRRTISRCSTPRPCRC